MKTSNDNFADESDFLLKKARDILLKYADINSQPSQSCALINGGTCPIINIALASYAGFFTPKIA